MKEFMIYILLILFEDTVFLYLYINDKEVKFDNIIMGKKFKKRCVFSQSFIIRSRIFS